MDRQVRSGEVPMVAAEVVKQMGQLAELGWPRSFDLTSAFATRDRHAVSDDATPLSDLLTRHAADGTPASYDTFLRAFSRATVGVIAHGVPPGTVGAYRTKRDEVGLGATKLPDGTRGILVCADREAFVRRYGGPYNAEVVGMAVMQTALTNPDTAGILVNSATSKQFIVTPRSDIELLVAEAGRAAARKPWWKLW